MRNTLLRSLAVAALLATAACQTAAMPTATSDYIVAAVADPARPSADTDRDVNRKPAEMIAFGEVHPGDKIGELIPGGGYMTRILSRAVGPKGHVYLFNGPPRVAGQPQGFQPILDDTANYGNVSFIQTDFTTLVAPEKLDLVWTSQNYHDLHNPGRNIDINVANKAVMDALKPGGLYVVLDHQSAAGVDFDDKLHRINMQRVKDEVLAAGFQFVGESMVLDNPADDGTKAVFDPSIRGKTDQFILKFRKPG
jgi:predicted methyltransferase